MLLITLLILSCGYVTLSEGQGGVYLSLNERNVSNGSYVDVNTIGDRPGPSALLCQTDLLECCSGPQIIGGGSLGDWYYPDGRKVGYDSAEPSSSPTFHRDRGQSVLRLWRHGNPPESGLFCCRVPDSSNTTVTVTVCANIVDITITDQPAYQQVIRGSTAVLSINAHIAMEEWNMLIYQWQKDNQTIDDGTKFEGTRTAQLRVKSFGANDEGVYRCVLNDLIISDEAILTLGVYLLFDGRVYSNDSVIDLDKQDNFRVTCYTNNTDCCRSSDTGGNWYFPSGEPVLTLSESEPPTFVLNRRPDSLQLYVYGLGAMERGRFLCKVPNSNNIEESIFIQFLSKPGFTKQPPSLVLVNPSTNETLIAEGYGGELKYQWFRNGHMITDGDKYQGTATANLTITTILKSDEGLYHCFIVNDLGNVTSQNTLLSLVKEPEIGMSYSLTCSVAETGQLHPSITYQWYKDGERLLNKSSSVLPFESLTFCDAGNYSCGGSLQETTFRDHQQLEIKFTSIQIQLYLSGKGVCSELLLYINEGDVVQALVQTLNARCLCGLRDSHFTMRELTCDPVMDGLIFSATLFETEQASTTQLINHLIMWINESAQLNLTALAQNKLLVERLLSPSCLNDIENTVMPSGSINTSRALLVVEIVMWIALVFLMCAIIVVIVMSLSVVLLKKKLDKAKRKTRLRKNQESEIATNINMSYQQVRYEGSNNESQVDGEGYVSQVYEEIEHSSDEHYATYY